MTALAGSEELADVITKVNEIITALNARGVTRQSEPMGFKEIIQEDSRRVFLNPEEFGELHEISGRKMLIIIDDNEMVERKSGRQRARDTAREFIRSSFFSMCWGGISARFRPWEER